MADEEVEEGTPVLLSLLLVESELVKAKRKLQAHVPDLSALLQAIAKELSLGPDDELVLTDAKQPQLEEVTELEQLGTKAKLQVWTRAGFETARAAAAAAAAPAPESPASPAATPPVGALALDPATPTPAVNLDAAEQRMEDIGVCCHGLWAIGVLQNDQGVPYLCAAHPVGVHVTMSALSGGSFRCRSEHSDDTLYFKDGSSKSAQSANAKNVSAPRCNMMLRRVAPDEIPEDGTQQLQAGVTYQYGDYWSLTVAESGPGSGNGTLEIRNSHKELTMKTTFDGRPVTKPFHRYPGLEQDPDPADETECGRYCLRLHESSDVRLTDAWGRQKDIFCNPERVLKLTVSSTDPLLAEQLPEGSNVTVEVTASYARQLLEKLAEKLSLPCAVKLMYPDPDFGELCLMTSLTELKPECEVVLKGVPEGSLSRKMRMRNQSMDEQQLAKVTEYEGFLKNVPLFEALSNQEVSEVAANLVEEVFAPDAYIIREGDPGHSMYVLKSGKATATKEGYEFEIDYQPGDFFGELALLTANPRGASIKTPADSEAVVLKVERKQFMLLVGKASTLLERNREMYDMVNQDLLEVRLRACAISTHTWLPDCRAGMCTGVRYKRTFDDTTIGGWPWHTSWERSVSCRRGLVIAY
eukprot:COSAG02_NODE_3614_length_6475_cov_14.873275_1_plen_640_part_00